MIVSCFYKSRVFVFTAFSLALMLLLTIPSFGQLKTGTFRNQNSLTYGFRIEADIEFGIKKAKPNPYVQLKLAGGIASNFLFKYGYPSLQGCIRLYNGGLGAADSKCTMSSRITLDAMFSIMATVGLGDNLTLNKQPAWAARNAPLNYFSSTMPSALQNPFDCSLSIGTNLVFTSDPSKHKQRIGVINLHAKSLQLTYYNDGGFFLSDLYLGDRNDRYYTGGGIIGIYLPRYLGVNDIEVAYEKFTGFSQGAFEISNKLYLDYMYYSDTCQEKYNKSRWTFNIRNHEYGIGARLAWYDNVKYDLQHSIHSGLFNAFHLTKEREHIGIALNKIYANSYSGLK